MKKFSVVLLAASILISGMSAFAATPTPAPTVEPAPAVTAVPSETALPSASPDATQTPNAADVDNDGSKPVSTQTPSPTPSAPPQELSTEFNLTIDVEPHKYIISSNAVVELYNDKDELLGSQLRYVGWDTPSVSMVFTVPQYRMGEKFKIKLVSGLRSLRYYDDLVEPGGTLEVQTYGYLNDEGKYTQCNGAVLAGNPHYEKELRMYAGGKWLTDLEPHARIVDGISMMPVRAIGEAMGLKVTYNQEEDSVACSAGTSTVVFYANDIYMTVFGEGVNSPHETVYIEGSLFVPVRTLAEAFDSNVEVADYGTYMDILIGESPIIQEFRNQTPVNRDGIGSKTNYLVWVSKHEYTVRVYEGQQYNWTLLKEFPCALGAWNTPTITGQFEYIERTQWNYSGYYVGPVLRFHNGYALHSTLLYYDGTEYDGRVGVNISHGCVRLHPQDINWIANTIPFRTRIYITE